MRSATVQDILSRHEDILKPLLTTESLVKDWKDVKNTKICKELMSGTDVRYSNTEEYAIEKSDLSNLIGPAYIPAETTVRNDYSQHFIDSKGVQLPGNAVGNPNKSNRFDEYPKLKKLVEVKNNILNTISHPPFYLRANLLPSTNSSNSNASAVEHVDAFHLSTLMPIKFDVVIIDPPLECYEWEGIPSGGETARQAWSWDQVAALPIPQLMAKESFIFLWVGSGASDGLERGREALMRWGYRRCEDIVWVQTNDESKDVRDAISIERTSSSCFAKSARHCLMGIRGTVRRSTDSKFVHCNIDTDVVLWPGERSEGGVSIDARLKPPEMMDIAENFCLGTRRLELFGTNRNLRRGWLTIGADIGPDAKGWDEASLGQNSCAISALNATPQPYTKSVFDSYFRVDRAGCNLAERSNLVPYNEEIDLLRPRSPSGAANRSTQAGNRMQQQQQQQQYQTNSPNYISNMPSPLMQQYGSSIMSPNLATYHAGGAGISGLGAGGPSVVSVPSGSEMLSGAQATVFMGQTSGHSGRTQHLIPLHRSKDGSPAL